MPARVSGSLNAGTVQHVEKYWPPLRCVTIFVLIFEVLSLLCAQTTGGFKSFVTVTVC